MGIGADSLPLDAILRGLNFEPVVVLLLIGFDIKNDGLELFLEPVLPLRVLGSSVNRKQGNLGCCFFDGAHHCCNYYRVTAEGEGKQMGKRSVRRGRKGWIFQNIQ